MTARIRSNAPVVACLFLVLGGCEAPSPSPGPADAGPGTNYTVTCCLGGKAASCTCTQGQTCDASYIPCGDGTCTSQFGPPCSVKGADAGPDDGCVFDCFGGATCLNGTVTSWKEGSPPKGMFACDTPVSTVCSNGTSTCLQGCRKVGSTTATSAQIASVPGCEGMGKFSVFCAAKALCEEHRPKLPGDLCADAQDCQPVDLAAGVTTLGCTGGTCQ